MTVKSLSVAAVMGLLVTLPRGDALAGHLSDTDSVSITAVSISGCGQQSLTFHGTATYSEPTQHLVITHDDTELLHSHEENATWATGTVTVGVGTHTVTATIFDKSSHTPALAAQSLTFTIPSCTPSAAPSVSAGTAAASTDCCPGPDEEQKRAQKKIKPKGRVKAAASARKMRKLPERVRPINLLFRKVYHRTPAFAEWEYWTRRQLSDKPQYDALFGAMQWHKLRGHTTGGPNALPYLPHKKIRRK